MDPEVHTHQDPHVDLVEGSRTDSEDDVFAPGPRPEFSSNSGLALYVVLVFKQ
jgi:hypothetical protein